MGIEGSDFGVDLEGAPEADQPADNTLLPADPAVATSIELVGQSAEQIADLTSELIVEVEDAHAELASEEAEVVTDGEQVVVIDAAAVGFSGRPELRGQPSPIEDTVPAVGAENEEGIAVEIRVDQQPPLHARLIRVDAAHVHLAVGDERRTVPIASIRGITVPN